MQEDCKMEVDEKTKKIAELNDGLRKGDKSVHGKVMITKGVKQLLDDNDAWNAVDLFGRVSSFDSFDEDNDPYGEHDCAIFEYQGRRVIWKIDYYALEITYASKDPSNNELTCRVLTIMLGEDY